MDLLPLVPLGTEMRAFPPTQRTLRVTVVAEDFGAACRVRQGVLADRLLTSIHEHREELELTATVHGPRRVTADNPFLSDQQRSRLDEQGVIRQGLVTQPGDVLISVLQVQQQRGVLQIFSDPTQQSVSDASTYVQPQWVAARVEQSEHVPHGDLGRDAPKGVESLSMVRLVRERDLELGDVLLIEGQTVVVAGFVADADALRDIVGQPADVVLSLRIGGRLGLLAGKHQSLAVAKVESRAADMLQVRSTGAYSLITLLPLRHGTSQPQKVGAEQTAWLQARGLFGILGELVSLKADDLLGRESIAAGLGSGKSLDHIDIPTPAAPDSAAFLVSWLEALGLNVRLEPAEGCVKLSVWPATTEEQLARSHGMVTKAETINYRTYADEPGGIFCPKIFGPSDTRRRRRFGHISLPSPIVPILWRLGNPSLLEGLLGLSPDEIERIVAYQADVFVREGQVRLEEHNAGASEKDLGPEWTPLHTGGMAIRGLLERLPAGQLPPTLRGRVAALTPEVVLVPPPDLRPLVLLDSGNFATSDLNDHLRRVINRRNRLAKLIELKAPQVILDNEMRMLQQTVDGLFANTLLPEGQVMGSSNRPLKCTLSMALGDILEPRSKRVDWSDRARVLVQEEVPPGEAVVPCRLFETLQLDSSQPVLLTRQEADGAFVAVVPKSHAAEVLLVHPRTAESLQVSRDEISEVALHRPLGEAACAEAMRLHRDGPPPARALESQAGWLQARSEGELIAGLVAAAMSGEAARLDTPELLLIGGTGSVEIAPDDPEKSTSREPRTMQVPVPTTGAG